MGFGHRSRASAQTTNERTYDVLPNPDIFKSYRHAFLWAYGASFTGGATGQRYSVSANAVIDTAGSGPNFFPGNAAGDPPPGTFSSTGGLYV